MGRPVEPTDYINVVVEQSHSSPWGESRWRRHRRELAPCPGLAVTRLN